MQQGSSSERRIPMLRTLLGVLCVALVWSLCLNSPVIGEEKEKKGKRVEATIKKIDGNKITLTCKEDDKEKDQEVDVEKDKIKITRGNEEIKVSDLKEGDKVRAILDDNGKITAIRIRKGK